MTTTSLNIKYNLSHDQADEIGYFANEAVKLFFEQMNVDFETNEDGVTINNTDEEVIEMSNGNFDTVGELTVAADGVYFEEYEMRAKMII